MATVTKRKAPAKKQPVKKRAALKKKVAAASMFKTAFVAVVAVVVPALVFGCVHDVKTESAADFTLASGQTWDWVPGEVKAWEQYKQDIHKVRINSDSSYERQTDRVLKREHKHIQMSIQGEMASKGIQRVQGETPTYYVAYYLLAGGEAIVPYVYAAYDPADWEANAANYDEDTLVIDIVDPASGKVKWFGLGEGNTRYEVATDDAGRMRGVKEAVRHIMRDLK